MPLVPWSHGSDVAHRLDAARSDQVPVMKDGAVVEQGAPQEPADCDGAFERWYWNSRVP